MTWFEIAAIVVLLLGIGAGGFLFAQRPAFWTGIVAIILKAVTPYMLTYVLKRMSPEEEKEMQKCLRRGGEWDNLRKRCRDK